MAKLDYDANGFGKFVKSKYYNATNAARCFGLNPLTIIKNIKNPTGGYKLFGNIYQELFEQQQKNERLEAMYSDLAQKYNDIINNESTDVEKIESMINK